MFSRTCTSSKEVPWGKDNKVEGSTSVIQRKTFEQIGMEQICDAIDELKDEVKGIREELRSFHSKFESWQDLNKIIDNIKRREDELQRRQEEFLKLTKEETTGSSLG